MRNNCLNRKDRILLSIIFLPLFPLKLYFLSALTCEIFRFNTAFSVLLMTLSSLAGLLLVFYFYRCMSANAFYMNKRSSFSLYLIYYFIFFIFFRNISSFNVILAFFASFFVSRKAYIFGEKSQIPKSLFSVFFLTLSASVFSIFSPIFFSIPEIGCFSFSRIMDFFSLRISSFSAGITNTLTIVLLVPFALSAGFFISRPKRGIDR